MSKSSSSEPIEKGAPDGTPFLFTNPRVLPAELVTAGIRFVASRLRIERTKLAAAVVVPLVRPRFRRIFGSCVSWLRCRPVGHHATLEFRRGKFLLTDQSSNGTFVKTDDGENLIQAFRRANNILSQAEEKDGVEYSYGADVKFAESDEERALFSALDAAEASITPAMESEDFVNAMTTMAELRGPIDAFFEAVQINTDNSVVRRNRLNLLSRIRQICLSVADLTKIEG